MEMKEKIVLGTSIAPNNIEQQLICIQSWIDHGFYVVSCNTFDEIEHLRPFCSNMEIQFKEVECDLDSLRTKKLPFIHDILVSVFENTDYIGGFCNSDIYIDHMTKELYQFIYRETLDSFVFVRRNEIGSLDDIKKLNWKIHFDGIDLFLLDKRYASDFFDDGFFVQSCWDSCVLLKARMMGIPIKELMNPIAFHKRHSQKWDAKTSRILVERFWNKHFHTKEQAFGKAMKMYYDILLHDCKQICFINEKNFKCLFVVSKGSLDLKKCIEKQECSGFTIVIQETDDKKEEFDYVFYIFRDVELSPIFCKNIVFIMSCCTCSELELGEFYVVKRNEERSYGNLNRSIELLEHIQDQCRSGIFVKRLKKDGIYAKTIRPVVYKEIDIHNRAIVVKFNIHGSFYITPAGIRANQWYEENKFKLSAVKFLGFLDKNKKERGEFGDIMPIETLKKDQEAYVIVASKYYIIEIMEQIRKLTKDSRIINAGCICHIDADGTIYYFDIKRYIRYLGESKMSSQGDVW